MPNLKTRLLQPEIMDDPSLDGFEHKRALKGLERVHLITRTVDRLWKSINKIFEEKEISRLSILDIGCGDGLLLRRIFLKAKKLGFQVDLIGSDFSYRALELAQEAATAEQIPIKLVHCDVVEDDLEKADVVICSLFLHHFDRQIVVEILKKMTTSAKWLVLVEDLLRTQLGYYLCWLGVHLLSRSSVVHTDGLLSVKAAFSWDEVQDFLSDAKIDNAKVIKHWPERFLVSVNIGDRKNE